MSEPMTSVPVPAAMPSEEEMLAAYNAVWQHAPGIDAHNAPIVRHEAMSAVLDLFAPILAGKERCISGLLSDLERERSLTAASQDMYKRAKARALAAEAALAGERERVRQLVRLLDQQMGTPCEQIRYQQDIDNLRAVTTDAIEAVESWAEYASPYIREKHGLREVLSDLRERAAAIRAQGE